MFLYKAGEHELAHALSIMWKSLITSIDVVLTLHQQKVAHIEQNIDIHVKGKIEAFKDRLEKANMELEDLIKKKDARIQEQDATIARHIILYSRLQENYRSLHHVIDSYKDPQGMAEFREILTRMNKDLNFLIAEKQV